MDTSEPAGFKAIPFNFGQITHPEFGTSNGELRGTIPLIPSSGHSNSFTPILGSTDLKTLVKETFQETHQIWDEELDEDILLIIENYILLSAFLCPHLALDNQRRKDFKMVVKFWLIADGVKAYCREEAEADNYNLDVATIDPEGREVRLLRVIGASLSNGEVDEEDMPSVIPSLKRILPHLVSFVNDLKEITPDFKIKFKPFKKVVEKAFYAVLFPKNEDDNKSQPKATDVHLWRYISHSYLELIALLEKIWITEDIRKDPLHLEFVRTLALSAGLLHSLFTVNEVIELNTKKYSELLTGVREGKTLKESFDDIYNRMTHTFTILVNTGKTLRSKYSQNSQLERYIRSAEDLFNGQVFWYSYLYSKSNLNRN